MTKEFWKAAFYRAVRTFCQTAIATIGTAAVLEEINWAVVGSASAVAALLSLLTSIVTGLPEVSEGKIIFRNPELHEEDEDGTL